MKYTAEGVRAIAKRLHDYIMVTDGDALMASDKLTAYASRIKADEGAANKLVVPVAWMCETVNGYKVFNAEGPSFPCNAGVVSELFTHPPAQAAQGETACPKCGAANPEDAATRCCPDGDSCPGCEEPLAQAWDRKAAQPAQSVDVEAIHKVIEVRDWLLARAQDGQMQRSVYTSNYQLREMAEAINVFADKLEAAIKGEG